MENIIIEGKPKSTPSIRFDFLTGKFFMGGCSMPEDPMCFYSPIIQKLKKFLENPLENMLFEMEFDYFNTASSKMILEILDLLAKNSACRYKWYYSSNDEDMLEAGVGFKELLPDGIDFEFCIRE